MGTTNFLKVNEVANFEGKCFVWSAPAYRANIGYFGYGLYGGVATVMQGKLTTLVGDEIEYAKWNGELFHYTDSDRFITIVKELNLDIENLLAHRKSVSSACAELINTGETLSEYSTKSGYAFQPLRKNFKTDKQYKEAISAYYVEMNKSYSIYKPFEDKAREMMSRFNDAYRNEI
ncbi:MAG TPA: hypothetical protein DCQ31_13235 [Bacteroidales bacterium]|nr:hypothetical protein [Bacteroidales bacterium]